MALRGKKPEAVQKRLKLMLFGPPGVGKTTIATQAPKTYYIDTERGAENKQYVAALESTGAFYWFSNDLDEIIEEVLELMSTKHDFKTVVIDSLTEPYTEAIRKAVARMAQAENKDPLDESLTAFGRNKIEPDRKIKQLFNLLNRLDMNVIVTAQAKDKYVPGAKKGERVVEGITFDCYGKLEYKFDLVLEMQQIGEDRVATVKKSRIQEFGFGERIVPFTYATLADRYGSELLTMPSTPVTLATPDQVADIERMVGLLKVPGDIIEKWLEKASAESFREMPADTAAKCVEWLNERIIKGAA